MASCSPYLLSPSPPTEVGIYYLSLPSFTGMGTALDPQPSVLSDTKYPNC